MTLGVDHLALSTNHVRAGADRLVAAGYETAFIEDALENAEGKMPFLGIYHPTHAIALCRHSTGTAIEWTDHHSASTNLGSYQLLLDDVLPLASPQSSTTCDSAVCWTDSWRAAGWPDVAEFNEYASIVHTRETSLPSRGRLGGELSRSESECSNWNGRSDFGGRVSGFD